MFCLTDNIVVCLCVLCLTCWFLVGLTLMMSMSGEGEAGEGEGEEQRVVSVTGELISVPL